MCFTILVLSLVLLSVSSEEITISKEYELDKFLCDETHSLDDDIVLVLSDNITHFISNNVSFCGVINDTYSLTLTSESSKQALIQCNDSGMLPNSGFAFINIHSLTLTRLVFTGCGEELKRLAAIGSINSRGSPMHFTQYHSAVLVFFHINTLLIDEVNITNYYGFAILSINTRNTSINYCNITNSYGGKGDGFKKDFGSGLFFLFTDVASSGNCNLTIQRCILSKNFEYYQSKTESICDFYHPKHNQEHIIPIFNAAGLSVFNLQKKFITNIQVMQSQFIHNRGTLAAAVLILYYNSVQQSQVHISNATFENNFSNNGCRGSDLSFIFYVNKSIKGEQQYSHQLCVSNSSFSRDKSESHEKGIIYLYIYNPSKEINVTLIFSRVNFTSIVAKGTGICLHAVSDISDNLAKNSTAQVILTDITAVRNTQLSNLYTRNYHQSIFVIENFDYILLAGNSTYTNNYGSVFGIKNTKVILDGRLHFENNTGNSGSAFMLTGFSRFILNDKLNATFIHNVAFTSGGAIYAYNDITSECMFTPLTPLANGSNITMLFINNNATYSGNAIFSNNLYNCSTMKNFDAVVAKNYYHALSRGTILNKTDDKQLSTVAFKPIICYNDTSNFMNDNNSIVVYPGMVLQFPMSVLDAFNQSTDTDVSLNLLHFEHLKETSTQGVPSKNWYVTPIVITLSQNNCTTVNVSIFKRTEHDSPLGLSLLMSIPQVSLARVTHFNPKRCPPGLEFVNSTHKCECSHVLHKIDFQPVCKISSDGHNSLITIKLITSYISHSNWIGTLRNGTAFGVSSCCYNYCRYKNNCDAFVINDSAESIDVLIANSSNYDNKESLCLDNREGPLCSQCIPGYSVTFGSSQCAKCSNWWLLTLIVYGLAGPLLIYLLYTLNLTLTTGKLNGIIFYSQMLNNTNILLRYHNAVNHGFTKFIFFCSRGIVLLINLNISFNIPLCFYDGMSELWKSGLGLLFPVYLLSIVIGLIIISRYSVKLSNRIARSSIQVLVTVVHLSFSTLLSSLIDVFTPAYIHTNTSDVPLVVWQNDGTVDYGKGCHLILMIVTGLIVSTILTTYLTVLLAGRPLMKIDRIREYLRPIYEAIHAPYRPNREFFFSFSTIFIALTYLISTLAIGTNPEFGVAVGVSVTCLYLNIVGFSSPFKSMHLNVLSVVIYSVVIILTCSFWCIVSATASIKWAILATFCHLIIIIILLFVITGQLSFGKKLFSRVDDFFLNIKFKFDRPLVHQENLQQCDSFYQSCNEREPLLNS
uniref:G-protein coupled receptors family 3 profile domain-containing protein n=1 Tax=Amphimedon queenslandica TaxID=400682 RepID=A0A1X7VSJ4_AMPQE